MTRRERTLAAGLSAMIVAAGLAGAGTVRAAPPSPEATAQNSRGGQDLALQQQLAELSARRNVSARLVEAFARGERDVLAHVVIKSHAVNPPFYRPIFDDKPEALAAAWARVLGEIGDQPELASVRGDARKGLLSMRLNPASAAKLAASPYVLGITPDPGPYQQHLTAALNLSNVAPLHASGVRGNGRRVAVIDTKFQPATLGPVVVDEQCFSEAALCPNGTTRQWGPGASARPVQTNQPGEVHGTRVASIVASIGSAPNVPPGAAPSTGIVAIAAPAIADVWAALQWIGTRPEIDVVVMSIGAQAFPGSCDSQPEAQPWLSAVQSARATGKLVVASMGNGNNRGLGTVPACLSNVVGVAGTWTCNHEPGSTACPAGAVVDQVWNEAPTTGSDVSLATDVFAPSGPMTLIQGIVGTTFAGSGTSWAAPLVGACAAMGR